MSLNAVQTGLLPYKIINTQYVVYIYYNYMYKMF